MTTAPPLPPEVYAAAAAGGVVRLPAGTFTATKPLEVLTPSTVLTGGPLTLEYPLVTLPKANWRGLWVRSDFRRPDREQRPQVLEGAVWGGDTGCLALRDPDDPPAPGERVFLSLGVSPDDPAEPADGVYATVAAVAGGRVYFTEPLPRDVPVYGSSEALRAACLGGFAFLKDKVAPWGRRAPNGGRGRGLGREHELMRFRGGRPVADVWVEATLTVRVTGVAGPADYHRGPNGGWAACVQFAERVTVADLTVDTCPGHALHLWHAHDLAVGRLRVTGDVFARIYDTQVTHGSAVSLWGGERVRVGAVEVAAWNCGLLATEVGPANVDVGPCSVRGGVRGQSEHPLQLNTYGRLRGDSRIGPVVFQDPVRAGTAMLRAPAAILRGCDYRKGAVAELDPARYRWAGPLIVEGKVVPTASGR